MAEVHARVRHLREASVRFILLQPVQFIVQVAVGSTPEELAASLKSDVAKWARVIRSANIRPAD